MDPFKKSWGKSSLFEVLSAILPNASQTNLLRTCLLSGDAGHQSWESWLMGIGDQDPLTCLRQGNKEVKHLLPLLFHAITKNNISVDRTVLTFLRTAYFREELRHSAYRDICHKILSLFSQTGIQLILLKGSSLAYTVYENPLLRHCHDIDILLKESDSSRALFLLQEHGFFLLTKPSSADWENIHVTHQSGLPVVLHRHLFGIPFHNTHSTDFLERSIVHPVVNIPTHVLSPSDSLFHICGHAFCGGSRQSLRWVTDSWFIIHHHKKLDWDRLDYNAKKCHLGFQVSIALDYLVEQLDACIPESVLTRLHDTAERSAMIGYEAALFGLRASGRGGFRSLFKRGQTWRAKALIVKWMCLPSAAYMRWVQQVSCSWLLPFFYVFRPLRYILYRIKKGSRGDQGPSMLSGNTFNRI